MNESKYAVYSADCVSLIATEMDLDDALLLCKALIEKYYKEPTFGVSIVRLQKQGVQDDRH